MDRRHAFAAAVLGTLAAAGAGLLRAQDGEVADGLPSLAGHWEGRISMKPTGLNPSVDPDRVKQDCVLDVTQTDANVNAVLTLPGDLGDEVTYLHGQVGNGSFWLTGDTSGFGTPMQVVGRASGAPGSLKMKASGVGATTDSVFPVSLQARQTTPSP